MSYLVLARKYRPRVFADVAGQEIATATLRGAIEEKRIGHAYLFCGPRGTGKTTTARIFAKALNCERGPTPEPCGTCERCTAADHGADVDLIEIDAASNNSVEFVRDLRTTVASAPMRARFKIYIIDEVHMLSKPAFNALLKTLEEPPAHVKFLFATTEPNKVLDTVLSRCQVLKLVALPERTIVDRLTSVFAQEGIRPGAGVVDEIARRARGGMRDALSIADQLVSMAGDEPELTDLERVCGDGGAQTIEVLLDRIEAHDAAGVLAALGAADVAETELLESLLDVLRGLLVVGVCGPASASVQADEIVRQLWSTRAARVGVESLQIWLEECLHARERIRLLPAHARLILEMTLLDLCRPATSQSLVEIERRLMALMERGASPGARRATDSAAHVPRPSPSHAIVPAPRSAIAAPSASAPARTPTPGPVTASSAPPPRAPAPVRAPAPGAPPAQSAPAQSASAPDVWGRFIDALHAASLSTLADVLRSRGRLVVYEAGRARVRLNGCTADERALLGEARNLKACANVFTRVAGQPTEFAFEEALPPTRPPPDKFTVHVNDMFGGRIEEDA